MGLVADSLDMLTDAAKEAHMKASMIFTSNDVIINAGVILAGVLVLLTQSNTPI
jgi:Co/Zn/Cd efflux system component